MPTVDDKYLQKEDSAAKTFDNKASVFDHADKMFKIDTSRYEVSYSPERSTMIENLKQRRQIKLSERKQNSMRGFNRGNGVPNTTKNIS